MGIQVGKSIQSKNRPNHLYAITSVALVLFMVGLFGLIVLHAHQLVRYFKENVVIMIELKDSASDTKVFAFQKQLESASFIKTNSVKLVDKEEAASIMRKEFGEELILFGANPFFDAINFNVKSNYMEPDSLLAISEEIRRNDFVHNVFYQEALAADISSMVRNLAIFTFFLSLLFILIAITLINSTVKLSLYGNRFLIKNMQLVGASWDFIRRPYLARSIKNGLWSGAMAIFILLLTLIFAQRTMPELMELSHPISFSLLFLLLLGLGVFISWASTYFRVHKYLKMRLDDLY